MFLCLDFTACMLFFSCITAVITEVFILRLRKLPVLSALKDGSAVVTGILLAYTLPPSVPWYIPVVGSFFAIAIAKHAFGGLGNNIWNPALAARFLTDSLSSRYQLRLAHFNSTRNAEAHSQYSTDRC